MNGSLLLLVGPSGAGKDSVSRALLFRAGYRMFPGYATRPMRPGEIQGNPYTFVTEAELQGMDDRGELFNNIVVDGHRYGLPRHAIREALERGERLILHLAHEWALQVKAAFPEAVLVLLLPPSEEEQTRRLLHRGESAERIAARQSNAAIQHPPREGVDLVVVNETDRLPDTVRTILAALPAETRGCPPPASIRAFRKRTPNAQETAVLEEHLGDCSSCRSSVTDRSEEE